MYKALFGLFLACTVSCNGAPDEALLDLTRGGEVEAYFNDPGSRVGNIWRSDALDIMVDRINQASASIDFAVMGFSHRRVVDAIVMAHDRGVAVRMVGDAGHLYNSGYDRMLERHIPMVNGNLSHIMHNKFMVIDDRFVISKVGLCPASGRLGPPLPEASAGGGLGAGRPAPSESGYPGSGQ